MTEMTQTNSILRVVWTEKFTTQVIELGKSDQTQLSNTSNKLIFSLDINYDERLKRTYLWIDRKLDKKLITEHKEKSKVLPHFYKFEKTKYFFDLISRLV